MAAFAKYLKQWYDQLREKGVDCKMMQDISEEEESYKKALKGPPVLNLCFRCYGKKFKEGDENFFVNAEKKNLNQRLVEFKKETECR